MIAQILLSALLGAVSYLFAWTRDPEHLLASAKLALPSSITLVVLKNKAHGDLTSHDISSYFHEHEFTS